MKRILFVDDEPRVLDGLRRMLHARRKEWVMEFALGGDAALTACQAEPFDVVVSDMRMPGMDGATLLTQMKQRFPNTVRIILTGHAAAEAAMRAVPVAHQYLNKPCDAQTLQEIITRACGIQDLLANPALQELIGRIESLPAVPRVYTAIRQKLAEPEWTVADLSEIIERDAAMVAKILQIANSGFFALPRHICTLSDAINFLGASTIEKLVLSLEVFASFDGHHGADTATLESHQRHSYLVGRIARGLHQDRYKADAAFTAGLLHDIGVLVMIVSAPDEYAAVLKSARDGATSLAHVERQRFQVTHAEIGAYLLGIWGLPYPIVEAVAFHHRPADLSSSGFDVASAVYIADCLAREVQPRSICAFDPFGEPLGQEFTQLKGIAEKIDAWRTQAQALAETDTPVGV